MDKIGIIGSGAIGGAIARLAVDTGTGTGTGTSVMIANSRGPASLEGLVHDLGERAHAGTAQEAASFGSIVVLAVPLTAYSTLSHQALEGTTVLSTGNYHPSRDGRIQQLDSADITTAEFEQSVLPGARIVKAFTNIVAQHIPLLAHSTPRTALPVFGSDAGAVGDSVDLVQSLGFDTVHAGSLADSWRTEPESGAYTTIYAESLEGFQSDYLADRGRPVTVPQLQELLAASHRPDVAGREF